eukprot:606920-Lingulodinium_polyedra.AAC.1
MAARTLRRSAQASAGRPRSAPGVQGLAPLVLASRARATSAAWSERPGRHLRRASQRWDWSLLTASMSR